MVKIMNQLLVQSSLMRPLFLRALFHKLTPHFRLQTHPEVISRTSLGLSCDPGACWSIGREGFSQEKVKS